MATVLLTRPSSCYVSCRRSGLGCRLLARLRAWSLDAKLARGECPDTSATLSLRAHELIGHTHRIRLAREIAALLREASLPPRPRACDVPICRDDVLHARGSLSELTDRLLSGLPIDARGMAQAQMLLCDGSSPVYRHVEAGALERSVRGAIEALEPRAEGDER